MSEDTAKNYTEERVERLLEELRYEVEKGMVTGQIDETLTFEFFVPVSRSIHDGMVHCRFETRPITHIQAMCRGHDQPRLRVVK